MIYYYKSITQIFGSCRLCHRFKHRKRLWRWRQRRVRLWRQQHWAVRGYQWSCARPRLHRPRLRIGETPCLWIHSLHQDTEGFQIWIGETPCSCIRTHMASIPPPPNLDRWHFTVRHPSGSFCQMDARIPQRPSPPRGGVLCLLPVCQCRSAKSGRGIGTRFRRFWLSHLLSI